MRLSDIMSNAGLSTYAEIALVIFLIAFLLIAVSVFAPSRRKEFEEASRMPLDDVHPQTPRQSRGDAS
ncbi:MAG: cbb3-type cytochrome c oxidase subunit 3 [Gemmatimonadales bacterium]|jgi:cbb3-type cytochrome oxidase subunit 3|nr:MAG: cbb3-type cytochrome c oxidase subunit 3 [Gemmatimonadales bacterium]